MQIIPPNEKNILSALGILRHGGVVAHATETCYGLACDVSNPQAVAKLFAIKQRPADQPVSILFSSLEQAKQYVEWNDEAEKLAKDHLPGPLTLILPAKKNASRQLFTIPQETPDTPDDREFHEAKTEGEWKKVHELRRKYLYEVYRPQIQYDPTFSSDGTVPDDQKKNHFVFVLLSAGDVVGTVRVDFFDEDRAAIRLVVVDGHYHNQGFGKKLLHYAEDFALKHNRRHLLLHSHEKAPDFYRKLGYTDTEPWEENAYGEIYLEKIVKLNTSLGMRISSHPLAQTLVQEFGSPLSTTSANIHGLPNPYSPNDILEQFKNNEERPDLILDSGILPPTPPSTIINLTGGGGVVRKGTIHVMEK